MFKLSLLFNKNINSLLKLNITSINSSISSRHIRELATVVRGNYARLTDRQVAEFERIVGPSGCLKEDLEGYNSDVFKTHEGQSKLVLRPASVDEVSAILRHCNDENLAVCPQGGNTGVVNGSIPIFDEIIVSTNRLNKIIDIDTVSGCLTTEAGVVLEKAQEALAEEGLITPYDLGSKGTCQIGGNLSTCAGGLRLLRYNSLLANTLGIQAVLPNGEILDCMNGLRKDNTGYHLRQLFIGAEGTLGIITAAVIHCPVKPSAVNLAFLGVDKFEDVLSTLSLAKQNLSEIVSALELIDHESFEISTKRMKQRQPLESKHSFYVMVETHGSNQDHDREKMDKFIETAMDKGLVKNGVVADQPSSVKKLWQIREFLAYGLSQGNVLLTYDITLPLNCIYDIITTLRAKYQHIQDIAITGFGHLGDGNIHVNVLCNEHNKHEFKDLEEFIYQWTRANKGSLSSEHGIGFRKQPYLGLAKSKAAIDLMISLKKHIDPKLILNPYKVLSPGK